MKYYRLVTFLVCIAFPGLLIAGTSAQEGEGLTTVRLDNPVHFLAPDGSEVLTKSGRYHVEPSDNRMRLIP